MTPQPKLETTEGRDLLDRVDALIDAREALYTLERQVLKHCTGGSDCVAPHDALAAIRRGLADSHRHFYFERSRPT